MYASVLTLSNYTTKVQAARGAVTLVLIHYILQPGKLFPPVLKYALSLNHKFTNCEESKCILNQ
ncbi:protein of unknown function [Candidatus Nitrotoga arctica]|uniref:Uncharacterized protein n=1 Tax=Candidatus Nitrotoga arctica TaxID=453162 RepID=A0ABM8Z2W9_9PROT|nr:protein of unknown function [Candidatus Nitrotoga arctica]